MEGVMFVNFQFIQVKNYHTKFLRQSECHKKVYRTSSFIYRKDPEPDPVFTIMILWYR